MKKYRSKNLQKDKKATNILIGIWTFMFTLLAVAFSSYTDTLGIESTAFIQSHIYDYVYITNMSIVDSSNASSINYSFLDHEFKANVSAPTCNSYITYKIDVVNTTPYKAYITNTSVSSMINGTGNNTSSLDVEFIGVTPNETYINPHETKSINVKIKNNCSGSDSSVIVKPSFEYSLYKYFDLTINATPNDSTISLTTSEGTFTGTGTLTHRVLETETANYVITKEDYYTLNNSYTMTAENHTINETLEKKIYLIFDANGGTTPVQKKALRTGDSYGDLPEPTKDGAIFVGWFSDSPAAHDSSKTYKDTPIYYYADTYADLYNAFGYDQTSLVNHYINNGESEGRRKSEYDENTVFNETTDKTIYAGWIYEWEEWNKKVTWDEKLILSGDRTTVYRANYMSYATNKNELNSLIDITLTNGYTINWSKLPDDQKYVDKAPVESGHYVVANSDSIKTTNWNNRANLDYSVYYAHITNESALILSSTYTADIYQVSNVRYIKGDNLQRSVFNCNRSQYPDNNQKGNYWYIKK